MGHLDEDGSGLRDQSAASPEQISLLYDQWAPDYDDDLGQWGYVAPTRIASMVCGADCGDMEVLDAGCGTGRVGVALSAAGVGRLIGADFSAASLDIARQRSVYDDLLEVDMNRKLPFSSDRFSAAVSAGVFTYISDAETTLLELLRITQPGGSVIFTQRTDLWVERSTQQVVDRLEDRSLCTPTISGVEPYLPGHPEFADKVGIFYTQLVVR